MKTLVNKNNPAIRIIAPEIDVYEEEQMFLIPAGDYCIPMYISDWTLVEKEPKHTEVWLEGRTIFEQEAKKPEVNLEKEYKEYVEDDLVLSKLTNRNAGLVIARHFYELGLKARKEK